MHAKNNNGSAPEGGGGAVQGVSGIGRVNRFRLFKLALGHVQYSVLFTGLGCAPDPVSGIGERNGGRMRD